jgi:RNA ligase (TIGR02306 family)
MFKEKFQRMQPTYTFPLSDNNLTVMIKNEKLSAKQVVVYGEVYGPSIQKLNYGVKEGYAYMVFDIMIDGKYVSWNRLEELCKIYYCIPVVPVLHRGEYHFKQVNGLAEGKTTVPNANHIREGVVVKPVIETTLSNGKRKVLKCKGADYLMWKEGKNGSDYTEE